MKFERLGVFTYSREEDTKAAEFEQQVPQEIKKSEKMRSWRFSSRLLLHIVKSRSAV